MFSIKKSDLLIIGDCLLALCGVKKYFSKLTLDEQLLTAFQELEKAESTVILNLSKEQEK